MFREPTGVSISIAICSSSDFGKNSPPTSPIAGSAIATTNEAAAIRALPGAEGRLIVSPGREDEGMLHMPTGQSGHPLSPFWGAGHDDWVHGRPTPFLPGPAVHTLTLVP